MTEACRIPEDGGVGKGDGAVMDILLDACRVP